ncbi:T9SS type A sorting domain-containing protein [Aquimarina sediminis]|uniref:T9SS type A sorting domain-containing protein n=1 Tax=Aquimarina sediminis TaxID=2070536 RepID=UPI000CA004FC|nr:T9SS type A sorting domain-containing protein [Aquimarina sediminis]
MKIKLLFFIVLILSGTRVLSQESAVSSGGNATGTGGTSSFTVGQVFYNTTLNEVGSIIEGTQQAFEIEVLSNPELDGIQLNVSTYPNPTTDRLTLLINLVDLVHISYYIHDIHGKLITKSPVKGNISTILMGTYAKGTYILSLKDRSNTLKTFKIIKK